MNMKDVNVVAARREYLVAGCRNWIEGLFDNRRLWGIAVLGGLNYRYE
jgi:hypothetical protein